MELAESLPLPMSSSYLAGWENWVAGSEPCSCRPHPKGGRLRWKVPSQRQQAPRAFLDGTAGCPAWVSHRRKGETALRKGITKGVPCAGHLLLWPLCASGAWAAGAVVIPTCSLAIWLSWAQPMGPPAGDGKGPVVLLSRRPPLWSGSPLYRANPSGTW